MKRGRTRSWVPTALIALALASAAELRAQVGSSAEDELRRALDNRTEARLELLPPLASPDPILILHPRLASGVLLGEVETAVLGETRVFESRAFPLERVRELRVRDNRFVRGTVLGAAFGLALAGTFHALCARDEDCGGPYDHPALYALSVSTFAAVGGSVSILMPGWKVVYSRQQAGLRTAQARVAR
jgi:hypothetical protein